MFQSCQRIAVVEIHIFQLGKETGEFFHIAGHEGDSHTVQLSQFILGPDLGPVDSFRSPSSGPFHFAVDAFRTGRIGITADCPCNHAQNKRNRHDSFPLQSV